MWLPVDTSEGFEVACWDSSASCGREGLLAVETPGETLSAEWGNHSRWASWEGTAGLARRQADLCGFAELPPLLPISWMGEKRRKCGGLETSVQVTLCSVSGRKLSLLELLGPCVGLE